MLKLYIANFPIVCIFAKQIFHFIRVHMHRIPLQNEYQYNHRTTIIRLSQHPGVVFSRNSTIFIPTLAIINIRNEKKTGRPLCLRFVSSSNESVDMARGNREYLDPVWDRCSTFRKGASWRKRGNGAQPGGWSREEEDLKGRRGAREGR